MCDDDMIRRGSVLERLDLAEHDAEERDWRSGANEIARLRKYVAAIPAADARAEALKEALQALRGAGSFGRTAAEKHAALEQYCLCRDAILALIPETKP